MKPYVFTCCCLILFSMAGYASAQEEDSIPYFPQGDENGLWTIEKKIAPKYPIRALRKSKEGCAAVGFIVESDGTTSAHRVIVSYPSSMFDESSINAAKQFVYAPTTDNSARNPIYTTNTFTYQISRGSENDEQVRNALADICTSAANLTFEKDT